MSKEIGRYITDDLKFMYITSVADDNETISVSKYTITLDIEKVFE